MGEPKLRPKGGCGIQLEVVLSKAAGESGVFVTASGWNSVIDTLPRKQEPAQIPAALAAGALGASELFRTAFGPLLGARARSKPTAGGFNLVTLATWTSNLQGLEDDLDLGDFHLVGAGAIGQ